MSHSKVVQDIRAIYKSSKDPPKSLQAPNKKAKCSPLTWPKKKGSTQIPEQENPCTLHADFPMRRQNTSRDHLWNQNFNNKNFCSAGALTPKDQQSQEKALELTSSCSRGNNTCWAQQPGQGGDIPKQEPKPSPLHTQLPGHLLPPALALCC